MCVKEFITAGALFLAASIAAGSATAADYSHVKDAYGYIVGIYTSGLLIAEVCSEYPRLKTEAEKSSRNYLLANSAQYKSTMKKMQSIALSQGGQTELRRLQRETGELLSDQEGMKREVKKTASSEAMCKTLLQNLRRGYWDLKTKAQPQIELIGRQ
jgi:hypothetical protein